MTTNNPVSLGGFFSLFDLPPTIYKDDTLVRLGTAMSDAWVSTHTRIPSGHVYLGQMLAHDVTKLKKPVSPISPLTDELEQLRTPMLDLDCVYGTGFDDPMLAVNKANGELILGQVISDSGPGAEDDLPRDPKTLLARIPDERNDENLLLAQLHVLFLKLHNFFVQKIGEENQQLTPRERFEEARTQVILHYQQVVLYDFLDTVSDPQVWEYVVGSNRGALWDAVPAETARMPVELSAAALRFGHSMVRLSYQLNEKTLVKLIDLFIMTGQGKFGGKGGLPETHVVDWRFFLHGDPETEGFLNVGRAIDPTVPVKLPPNIVLAIKNLQTGNLSRLPDGQAVVRHITQKFPEMARELNLKLLTPEQLNPMVAFPDENGVLHEERLLTMVGLDQGLTTKTPLWYYLLAEASATRGGQCLGVLGSLLVTDLVRALVSMSSPSVLLRNFDSSYIVPTKVLHGRTYLTLKDLADAAASTASAAAAEQPKRAA